jgi:hypothetical protein
MDEKAKARDLQEQADQTSQRKASRGHPREDWPDPPTEPCALAQDDFDMLHSHVMGHHWDGWRRLTGDEDYLAACSCGWRSNETGDMSAILGQVKDHLDAVREIRGGRPSTQAAAGDEHGCDASQDEMQPRERARELRASVEGEQMRLSQSLGHSRDLLAACADQADRLVAVLERGQWTTSRVSAPTAGSAQHKPERAWELRKAIVAAAATLAVIAEEITWIHQDLETRHPAGSAEYQPSVGVTSETAGTAREPGRTSGC